MAQPEAAVNGKRVTLATEALQKAADIVINKDFSDSRFAECFPTYSGNPELMNQLRDTIRAQFLEFLPRAWAEEGTALEFTANANALDSLLLQAKKRKEMYERTGQKPPEMYKKAADAELTVSSKTVPTIRQATDALRERRAKLQRKNEQTFADISRDMTAATRTEQQITEMVNNFNSSMEVLNAADVTELSALQEVLAELVPK